MSIADIITSIQKNGVSWLIIVSIVTTFVQISPIRINPWDNIFIWIGKLFNKDLNEKIDKINNEIAELKDSVDGIQEKQKEHISKDEEDKIIEKRGIIVSRARKIVRDSDHYNLEELTYFVSLTDDYDLYCETHPDFKNSVAVESIRVIREHYADKLRREGGANA